MFTSSNTLADLPSLEIRDDSYSVLDSYPGLSKTRDGLEAKELAIDMQMNVRVRASHVK